MAETRTLISPRALLAWGDLDERRRRAARRGPGAWPSWAFSLLAGLGLAALMARGIGAFSQAPVSVDAVVATSRLWLAALVAAHAVVMFGAPFRMYWRRDAAFLARLAVPGDALFRLALVRGVRATALVTLPCAMGALAFGPWLAWEIALRHLALAGVAALGAAVLAPAVALAAGAIVASDKAQAVLANMGGEFRAPKTSWLGMLPGFAATAVALVLIAGWQWALGGARTEIGHPALLFVPAVATCAAALLWALATAPRTLLAATREVSALDQERLAHVDPTQPSLLERLWARRVLRSRAARQIFAKDARLARRRFPIPYFVGSMAVVALWIVAAAAPSAGLVWAASISASLGVYGVVMARRRVLPPIEQQRFLRTLAVAPGEAIAAKRSHGALWPTLYQILGCAPVVARADDQLVAGILLVAIALASFAAACAPARSLRW